MIIKKRYWFGLSTFVVIIVLVLQAPAAWLAPCIAYYSHQTVSFDKSWGTIWHGSAHIRLHRSETETILLPDPIAWTLHVQQSSPPLGSGLFKQLFSSLLAIHTIHIVLDLQSAALIQPIALSIRPNRLSLSAGQYHLPAQSLEHLGAPFNTLKPTGKIIFAWETASIIKNNTGQLVAIPMPFSLKIQALRTAITQTTVLGDYQLQADPLTTNQVAVAIAPSWHLQLSTLPPTNPAIPTRLLLNGTGRFGMQDTLQFELHAQAATVQAEQQLGGLLNFLGRKQGNERVLRLN